MMAQPSPPRTRSGRTAQARGGAAQQPWPKPAVEPTNSVPPGITIDDPSVRGLFMVGEMNPDGGFAWYNEPPAKPPVVDQATVKPPLVKPPVVRPAVMQNTHVQFGQSPRPSFESAALQNTNRRFGSNAHLNYDASMAHPNGPGRPPYFRQPLMRNSSIRSGLMGGLDISTSHTAPPTECFFMCGSNINTSHSASSMVNPLVSGPEVDGSHTASSMESVFMSCSDFDTSPSGLSMDNLFAGSSDASTSFSSPSAGGLFSESMVTEESYSPGTIADSGMPINIWPGHDQPFQDGNGQFVQERSQQGVWGFNQSHTQPIGTVAPMDTSLYHKIGPGGVSTVEQNPVGGYAEDVGFDASQFRTPFGQNEIPGQVPSFNNSFPDNSQVTPYFPNPFPTLGSNSTPPRDDENQSVQDSNFGDDDSTTPDHDCYDAQRRREDRMLLQLRARGMNYRDIKRVMNTNVAESTLRGRWRSLTKVKKDRVRKPVWKPKDIQLLKEVVTAELERLDGYFNDLDQIQLLKKLSWKRIAEHIKENGGSYHFGNSTCKKKWTEIAPDIESNDADDLDGNVMDDLESNAADDLISNVVDNF